MIRDVTLGQYFPGSSFLHRMDPRSKILLMVFYVVTLFLGDTALSYGLLLVTTAAVILLTRISLKFYLRGLKPLLFIMVFTGILNMLYSDGEPLFEFWIFSVSWNGIFSALFMILRIVLMVLIMSVLTYTTSPLLLTGGLERLLHPLTYLRVPVHDFAMMMTIALRFIPTLLEETEKIMNAQKARGADFESGSLVRRAKALIPILIPLFVSAFRRAEELAVAMECRCYEGDRKNRTRFVEYRFTWRDLVGALFCAALLVGVILLNRVIVWNGVGV
ncbi:MAG: energy-coupling factor transporter transmembrane protein EcfT [Clostridia bacterium]|nr:energy-coupling factor transporter transmembrane protein EcfT [Clostridia bacterium]